MKRFVCLIFCVLLVASFLESSYVGKVYFKQRPGDPEIQVFRVPQDFYEFWILRERGTGKNSTGYSTDQEVTRTFESRLSLLQAYFESEEQKGNLRLRLEQDDPLAMMKHHRYSQYCKGLMVFGGEIINHYKEGNLTGINGEYYEIPDFDIIPLITREMAVGFLKTELGKDNLVERAEEFKLLIYPVTDIDFRLAYQIVLEEGIGYSMTGIVDAKTGEVLINYSNIQTDDVTIGKGVGYHGELHKLVTTFWQDKYWLYDEHKARPVNQYTFIYTPGLYIPIDSDNFWDTDPVSVNIHAYLGITYDYYYLVHGRKGIDNNNLDIVSTSHCVGGSDNANWHRYYKRFTFYDPGDNGLQTGAALDVVAHEFSHGVTQYTSGLQYFCTATYQPGALNESFSDIMGTAVEVYWQESGNGFNRADWVVGEDVYASYGTNKYMRSLSNPNSKLFSGIFPYPCHLSQCYVFPNTEDNDWGGVHFTTTLYSHAFYLLSEGGTNAVSHKSVSGIGIEKATEIFYRAWTHYLIPVCSFWYAAQALVQSAADLYGSSSDETAQTVSAMYAIGW